MSTPENRYRPEELPEELASLRLGGPRPTLRQDTLRAVRQALEEDAPQEREGWATWRVELGFVAAIAFTSCLLSLCLLSPTCRLPETLRPTPDPTPMTVAVPIDGELEELGPYTQRYRAATPRRVSERRYHHDDIDHL